MAKRNYTPSKFSQFHAICKTHGFDYKEKVAEFTNGETDSLRALTDDQFEGMMILMLEINKGYRRNFEPKPGDQQRKKLIGIAKQMFWGTTTKETVADVDRWCKKQKFKKALMAHTPQELNLLVAIFEQKVYPDYLQNLNR